MSEFVKSINSFTPDALIGGTEIPLLTKVVTLIAGCGTVARGTVLGKITKGAATVAAAGGGTGGANSGNGTLTMDATTPILAGAKVGAYTAKCITAATNGGVFRITDPDGFALGDVAVGATWANDLKFVIGDGSADFVVGDGFSITIAAGSGKYKPVNSANVDGSAVADCVAVQTVVVPADADAAGEAYTQGYFNGDHLVFGGTDTVDTHREALRAKNIILTNEQ